MISFAKPYLTKDEAQSAYDTILTGWIAQGPKVEEFEEKFCEYTGANYSVALSNCTTALHLAMIVAGIGKDDEVICPSMSYIATANCIKYVGANPVFAEIDPQTNNIDINHAKKLITNKTKAILIVHQMGMPADIDAFKTLCEKNNLKLIEDAACAIGSSYKGKKIGSHSDLICFSFHPRKLMTTGEGGMITTSKKEYDKRLKILRQHGMSVNDEVRSQSSKVMFEEYLEVGFNYRMTDFQAAIGIKQLEKLDWMISERRKVAQRYIDELKSIDFLMLPIEKKGYFSTYQSFSIYLRENCPIRRNDLMQKLLDKGIATRRGVVTSHRESFYRKEYKDLKLPVSEDASDKSILLPIYIPMKEEDIDYIISSLKKILL